MILIALALAIGTCAYPRWIELILGIDPDRGNGTLETLIVLACITAATASAHALTKKKR